MENNKVLFDIEDFSVVNEISDEQFAIVEVYVCHDGNNAHNMPIKLSTLKKAASTLRNKYLVAGFDGDDFEGHEPDEMIVGHFPESGKISYKKKNGKTYLVAEAIMSKVYANWAYDQFLSKNHRGVSMEISVTQVGEEKDGQKEIKEFCFNGVTILGDSHTPACEGADVSIIKFNVENASEFYSKYSWKSNVIVRDFVDSMRVETGKEGTENMKETENTVVEEVETASVETVEPVVEDTNETVETEVVETKETTEEEVFEDDKKDKEESDDTVSMEDKEDDDNDDDDESEDKFDKKDDKSEEEDMEAKEEDCEDKSKDKKFESLTVEQKYEVFRAACRENGLGWLESYDDEYLYVFSYNENYTYRYSYTLDGTEVTISDEKTRVMRGGYVPFEAENTKTEETTSAAENATNPEVETLQEENAKLKATVAEYEAKEKSLEVESILSSVIDTLSPEQINDLREESKDFSLDKMNEFSNKVKALAFESVKGKDGKYSFARMAFGTMNAEPTTTGKYSW